MSNFMKKNKYIAVTLLLLAVLAGSIIAVYQVNQFNAAQMGLKGALLDVANKQTWLDNETKIKAMDLVINSEIGFAVLYPEGSTERESMIEAGQSLIDDEYYWIDGLTPEREFLLYGSTTGVNFDELDWEKFIQAREDLEISAKALHSKKGGDESFGLRTALEGTYINKKYDESNNNYGDDNDE